jgi:hypothetical protein
MDLHGLVSGAIGTVNPPVCAKYYCARPPVTAADGSRVPTYAPPCQVTIQKQELSYKDLQHIDGLNLQGILCVAYLRGQVYAVTRGISSGGDKFVIGGQTWLVVAIPEQWPDWAKVILNLQVNP